MKNHKPNCQCGVCKAIRREPHKPDCKCMCCKAKRGEYKGENHWSFKKEKKPKKIYFCINNCNKEVSKEGNRCNSCAQKERFKDPIEKQKAIESFCKKGWKIVKNPSKEIREKMKIAKIKWWKDKKRPDKFCIICNKKLHITTKGNLCGSHARKKLLKENPELLKSIIEKGKNTIINNGSCKGPKNSNWKGGRVELRGRIHSLHEYNIWRKFIYERDKYRCQECFIEGNGKNLECHHIKPFEKILSEFLQTYSQFSPIEDKETLTRLAITYKDFWDVKNGITLCDKCHTKTKNFKKDKLKLL